MANRVSKKLQFFFDREIVKYVVFAVPSTQSSLAKTLIAIEKNCAELYPTIYLKKIEKEAQITNYESLDYPSIADHDLVLGDNFSTMLNEDLVSLANKIDIDFIIIFVFRFVAGV